MSEDTDNNSSDVDFGKLSKINSAGLVNSTLSNLWTDFFRNFRNGKYLSSDNDLDCIWTILGGENKVEGSDCETDYTSIETKLSNSGNLQDAIIVKGFGKIDDAQLTKFLKHKAILIEKALFLRRLQNSQGKGTAYHDGDDEEFD